ncbi:MAG: helix-turn-helix domain-containing protein [Actinomycetes bacterium]
MAASGGVGLLIEELGEQVRVAAPPPDPGGRVSTVLAWEPGAAGRLVPGALVLGINLTGEAGIRELLARAGEAGCAAVLLRDPGGDAAAYLAEAAQDAQVGLLLLGPAVPWTLVLRLADDVVRGRPADAEGGEVPLGDLFALADAIAAMVGGPATLEDADFRVLAYSRFVGHMDPGRARAILGRRMPAEWAEYLQRIGALERLRTTGEVVEVTGGPHNANRRLIVSVRDGTQVLGVIWIAEVDRPLPDTAADALRQAAELAVPHYRQHLEMLTARRRRRHELVRAILDGQGPVRRYADELDLPRGGRLAVLAFTVATPADLPAGTWERIADHVALTAEAWRWTAVVTRIGRTVFVIAHLPRASDPEAVVRLGRDIVAHAPAVTGQRLYGAASTPCTGVQPVAARRVEAELALAVCGEHAGFVRYDEVRAQVILHEVTALLRDRPELRLPGLERLYAEDERRGTLTPTLRAYLDSGGNVAEAANRLGVHPTTLRYRLDRIRSLTGLEPDDPDTRLACALLLRLAPEGASHARTAADRRGGPVSAGRRSP